MDRLQEIKEREKNATAGPWNHKPSGVKAGWDGDEVRAIDGPAFEIIAVEPYELKGYESCCIVTPKGEASNFDFIAHSREDVPWLVKRYELATRILKLLADMDEGSEAVDDFLKEQ